MALLFILGFLFDLVTLSTIDDKITLSVQTFYLFSLIILILADLYLPDHQQWPGFLRWFEKIRAEVFHFLLGALLSAFTIFYFKSSSLANSFIFMFFMALLLLLNEFPFIKKQGTIVRLSMLTLCLMSYHLFISALILKSVGPPVFFLALFLTLLYIGILAYILHRSSLPSLPGPKVCVGPVLICLIFTALYFFKLIPPVPLALSSIGVYRDVERVEGGYRLAQQRPWWRVWHRGDQLFYKAADDQITIFAEIFSPGGFQGQIVFHWRQWQEGTGFVTTDRIALPIAGGREEGYRAFTTKRHFRPGRWQVRVETPHGLEVGRIQFRVLEDERAHPPELNFVYR